jgi:hypothetical protein
MPRGGDTLSGSAFYLAADPGVERDHELGGGRMSEWQELRRSKVSGYRSRRVCRTRLAAVSVDG